MTTASYDAALASTGVGAFQNRLFAVFGLVWAADAMQVLAIGFTAPSIAATLRHHRAAGAAGGNRCSSSACWSAPSVFGRLADRYRAPARPDRRPC